VEVGSLLDLLLHQEVCLLVTQCEFGVQTMQDFQVQEDQQGGGVIIHYAIFHFLLFLTFLVFFLFFFTISF
jgi:hypothetical protein